MVRTTSRPQTGALCIGTTGVSKRGGWAYPAEQGCAADCQEPTLRFGPWQQLTPGVRALAAIRTVWEW